MRMCYCYMRDIQLNFISLYGNYLFYTQYVPTISSIIIIIYHYQLFVAHSLMTFEPTLSFIRSFQVYWKCTDYGSNNLHQFLFSFCHLIYRYVYEYLVSLLLFPLDGFTFGPKMHWREGNSFTTTVPCTTKTIYCCIFVILI